MAITLNTDEIKGWIRDASVISRRYFGNVYAEWKATADPVTIADRETEQFIKGKIRARYPDHGIIGEEYGGSDVGREYLWTVDPIDGTRVYVEGLPTWSITIALLHQNTPIFGLVYMPMIDDWTYTDGDRVMHNDTDITDRLMPRWQLDSYVLARSDAHAWWDIRFTRVMAFGSTAVHLAYTAKGASLATIMHEAYIWDVAAGAAILAKQGGGLYYQDGMLVDFSALDLTDRIHGLYFGAHPDVARRLGPLMMLRAQPIVHPVWDVTASDVPAQFPAREDGNKDKAEKPEGAEAQESKQS